MIRIVRNSNVVSGTRPESGGVVVKYYDSLVPYKDSELAWCQ